MLKNREKALPKKLLKEFLVKMQIARKFEEQVQLLFSQGLVHGTTHLGIGEEATAVGSCLGLKPQDYMLATHRGHPQALAKGMDVNTMMAEILAKATGTCHGKGGSMHIADIDKGILGANGVLGSSAPIACGAALAIRKRKEDKVVICYFGDGAANLGAIHEAMNLAAVWNLPVLFVLINNGYGMSTSISKASRDTDLSKRAYPFSIPAETIDGNDVIAIYQATKKARPKVVKDGPMLLVLNTYRISGHSKSDGNLYRSKEEIASWRKKCPILRLQTYLLKEQIFNEADLERIDEETTQIIQAAVEFGKQSPDPSIDTILTDVYA